jgi:hypothetical protein
LNRRHRLVRCRLIVSSESEFPVIVDAHGSAAHGVDATVLIGKCVGRYSTQCDDVLIRVSEVEQTGSAAHHRVQPLFVAVLVYLVELLIHPRPGTTHLTGRLALDDARKVYVFALLTNRGERVLPFSAASTHEVTSILYVFWTWTFEDGKRCCTLMNLWAYWTPLFIREATIRSERAQVAASAEVLGIVSHKTKREEAGEAAPSQTSRSPYCERGLKSER